MYRNAYSFFPPSFYIHMMASAYGFATLPAVDRFKTCLYNSIILHTCLPEILFIQQFPIPYPLVLI